MGSVKILKSGDPCPCCGSPIRTTDPVMLCLLTKNCIEKCPQAEMAHEIAKGRMYATNEFVNLVKKIESGQLVEVVWCKDCKYWDELNGKDSGKPVGYGYCTNPCGINGIAYEDSFCSFGERRTDD